MNSSTLGKDTFVHYLKDALANVIPVKAYTQAQQNLEVNALNIRFLSESNQLNLYVWDAIVSLDILVDESFSNTDHSERAASKVADGLVSVLAPGLVKKTWKNDAWSVDGGYIAWDTLRPNAINIKDIPQAPPGDLYMHKNITLSVTYFK